VADNASGVTLSGGSFPSGVSGSWTNSTYTISGTPTTTGTFNYTLAAYNAGACAGNSVAGTITVNLSTTDMPPDAASTRTWTIGSQTWSDRIARELVSGPAGCDKTVEFYISTNPPAQYKVYGGRYYYNGACVNIVQSTLCPSPWRVPTQSDFVALDQAFGGSGSSRQQVAQSWITDNYLTAWGGSYDGYGLGPYVQGIGTDAYYWSSTVVYNNTEAYILSFNTSGQVWPDTHSSMHAGYGVRCVR
jgi:uncharacterized protein (TIGR02145 family)